VTRTRRTAFVAVLAALAVIPAGCGNSRPPGVAVRPDDCYVELTDFQAKFIGNNLNMKVRYRFPERPPHPDAWFAFTFQVNTGAATTVNVRKKGSELNYEGEISANQSTTFVQGKGTITVRVRQAATAEGQYGDVSATVGVAY
jgi:hypothetical protein